MYFKEKNDYFPKQNKIFGRVALFYTFAYLFNIRLIDFLRQSIRKIEPIGDICILYILLKHIYATYVEIYICSLYIYMGS